MSDTLLGILVALFGGTSIWQFVWYRSTKRKYEAEAEQALAEARKSNADARSQEINNSQDAYESLYEQFTKLQNDFMTQAEELRKMIVNANEKCNEIARHKSKIQYLMGLRCYCPDCPKRIGTNPNKVEEIEEGEK